MQSPELFLNDLGITVNCVVDPARPALLDEAHRVFVNWETYYLSSDEALAKFRADPLKYVGTVTDPVTRERFRPNGKHTRIEHDGRVHPDTQNTGILGADRDAHGEQHGKQQEQYEAYRLV